MLYLRLEVTLQLINSTLNSKKLRLEEAEKIRDKLSLKYTVLKAQYEDINELSKSILLKELEDNTLVGTLMEDLTFELPEYKEEIEMKQEENTINHSDSSVVPLESKEIKKISKVENKVSNVKKEVNTSDSTNQSYFIIGILLSVLGIFGLKRNKK